MPAPPPTWSPRRSPSPIEQEINGVDNMIYMVSQSTGDGTLQIDVVFKPGTNIDQAQVLVQNRVVDRGAAACRKRCSASASRSRRSRPT